MIFGSRVQTRSVLLSFFSEVFLSLRVLKEGRMGNRILQAQYSFMPDIRLSAP